jgi:hypothetical protein
MTASPAATHTAATTPPVTVPLASLLPRRGLQFVLLVGTGGALLTTVLRPRQVPQRVQRAADLTTATIVGIHPIEALLMRRWSARRGVSKGVQRTITASTMAYGGFSARPAMRSIRRATEQAH